MSRGWALVEEFKDYDLKIRWTSALVESLKNMLMVQIVVGNDFGAAVNLSPKLHVFFKNSE